MTLDAGRYTKILECDSHRLTSGSIRLIKADACAVGKSLALCAQTNTQRKEKI